MFMLNHFSHVPINIKHKQTSCHSSQTAGNSNFTLFQMVYFFERLLSLGFHLNALYKYHVICKHKIHMEQNDCHLVSFAFISSLRNKLHLEFFEVRVLLSFFL
jgi:hypothetical protein